VIEKNCIKINIVQLIFYNLETVLLRRMIRPGHLFLIKLREEILWWERQANTISEGKQFIPILWNVAI